MKSTNDFVVKQEALPLTIFRGGPKKWINSSLTNYVKNYAVVLVVGIETDQIVICSTHTSMYFLLHFEGEKGPEKSTEKTSNRFVNGPWRSL